MHIPDGFVKALITAGGLNRFGSPNFHLADGETERFYPDGPLKYPGDVWMEESEYLADNGLWMSQEEKIVRGARTVYMEQWFPPELLADHNDHRFAEDPDTGETFDLLGPFPSKGRYIELYPLEDADGNPLELNDRILEIVRNSIATRDERLEKRWKETGQTDMAGEKETKEWTAMWMADRQRIQQNWNNQLGDLYTNAFASHEHRLTSANPTEGLEAHHRRGPTYDPNWAENLRKEKRAKDVIILPNNGA